MSSSFLAKRTISSYFFSSFPFHYHLRRYQLALLTPLSLLRHSLSTQTQPQPHKELPFIADYLISSFGFSPDRALKYSTYRHLAAIRSADRPEALIKFLKETGFSDTQIKAVVSFHPILLGYNVDRTLRPNVRQLVQNGFSGELLVQLIEHNPGALYLKNTLSRILFWKNFVGNSNEALLKMIPRNPLLFTFDIDKHIVPIINLLKEYGLSNQDIMAVLWSGVSFRTRGIENLRQKLDFIEDMGIPRGSGMFLLGIKAIGGFRYDKIKRNAEFFKVTYGWSEEDVSAAFRKFPMVLRYSADKVKSNMDFLIRKAGFESTNIALRPVLIGCSLENVLIPRYTVLSALEAKGLKNKCSLSSACGMSKRKFLERYVVPYEKDVPGLGEAYAAAYGGKVPV